ncbi:hypothetical protein hrd7_25320 [Leptolinea sp. HRD-7]|nr:hypothetical protein hrd7_25320 [Leptolinea sp. HRD-7]
MILRNAVKNLVTPTWTRPELLGGGVSISTVAGKSVSTTNAMRIATYYRALNLITDDLSMIPLQLINSETKKRVMPDFVRRNMAFAVEVQPNPYMIPFMLRKQFWVDVLTHGDGIQWSPVGTRMIINLDPAVTYAEKRADGNIWWISQDVEGRPMVMPDAEVKHVHINMKTPFKGRGVIEFARETLGTRMAGNETKAGIFQRGLMPSAIAEFDGDMNSDARQKVRDSYWEAARGSDGSGGVVVLDGKVRKFTLAEIKPVDAQFLESILAEDVDIANFFALPLYKLNQGKQSYESNDQQDEDYMRSTLDPYLVQDEQACRIKWLTGAEQSTSYWRYNRDAFLRMNSKARAVYLKDKILSGQMTPNEALAIDDQPGYTGGDFHFIPSNMAIIADGKVTAISKPETNSGDGSANEK